MPSLTPPALPPGTISGIRQPEIPGQGLTLRPWQAGDAGVLAEAYRDPEIRRWHVRSLTQAEALDWIAERAGAWANERGADWAVVAEGAVVGRGALKRIELGDGLAEVGPPRALIAPGQLRHVR